VSLTLEKKDYSLQAIFEAIFEAIFYQLLYLLATTLTSGAR
jgi:hypothetical protein